jgi:transposase
MPRLLTKAGNRRLRTKLVELAWRALLYQPNYYLVKKWKAVLLNPKAHARARKTGHHRLCPATAH